MQKALPVNRYDIILACFFLVLAAAVLLFCLGWVGRGTGGMVELRQDGVLIGRYPLDTDAQIEVDGPGLQNTVMIKDGAAFVSAADCPDQYCVQHAPVSRLRESIVCLPARLTVIVTEGESHALDATAR